MNFLDASVKNSFFSNKEYNNNNAVYSDKTRQTIEYKEGSRKRELIIVVDSREGVNDGFVKKIQDKMVQIGKSESDVIVEKMNIGDIHFIYKHTPDGARRAFGPLIERKTCSDLSSSIKDARYREQKGRMAVFNMEGHMKLYIYEGHLLGRYWGIAPKSLMGAAVKPVMKEENEIALTQNMEATSDFVVQMLAYLEHMDEVVANRRMEYVDYIQPMSKKSDAREHNLLACILRESVMGVSANAATAVVDKYASMGALQAAFITDPQGTIVDIQNIEYYGHGKDTASKIGVAVAKNIYNFCDIDTLRTKLYPHDAAGFDWDAHAKATKRQTNAKAASAGRVSLKPTKIVHAPLAAHDDKAEDIDDDDDDNYNPLHRCKKHKTTRE